MASCPVPCSRLLAEAMEDRVLHSADLGALLLGADASESRPADATPAAQAETYRSEIAFIDAALPDAAQLRDDLLAQRAAGRPIEVVLIGAGDDGITLITQTLAGRSDLSAVHVLSHGSDGVLNFGRVALDANTVLARAGEIAGWSVALANDADLLLYGCDVAQTARGEQWVRDLAALTGADVAASSDLTGAAAAGGNWVLEFSTGRIDAALAIDAAGQQAWAGTMAVTQSGVNSAASVGAVTNLTFSHTILNLGSDRLLMVELAIGNGIGATAVSYAGQALTFLAGQTSNGNEIRTELWYLVAPPLASLGTVSVTLPSAQKVVAGAANFYGVDQTSPFGTPVTGWGNTGPASVTVAAGSGDMVVDVAGAIRVTSSSVGAGQSQLFTQKNGTGTGDVWGVSSTEPGAASVVMSENFTTQGGAGDKWAAVAVAIKQVNVAAPTITSNGGGASASIAAQENSTVVTTVTATDPDSSNLVYSVSGGVDASRFTIDAATGVLRFVTAPNFEAPADANGDNVYLVTVRVSDGSLTDTQSLSVSVTDVNEFPVGAVSDTNASANRVAENAAIGTLVGITARAVDADGSNNTVTYALINDAGGQFSIHAASGVVAVAGALDRETSDSHTIVVRATSADGSWSTANFVIAVDDVNEFPVGPVSDADPAANTVAENAGIGTAVGITAYAVDPDATTNAVTYTLDDDAGGRFSIDAASGVLRVAGALDYETATSHAITVRATSADGSGSTAGLVIAVTDINEAGVGAISDVNPAMNAVAENAAIGTSTGIAAQAIDPDASDVVTYSLDDDAAGRFQILADGTVVTNAALDAESALSHSIVVRATSTDGSWNTQSFTIAVNDANEFAVGAISDTDGTADVVDENAAIGTPVGITAQATDADATNNTISYSLDDNAGGRFSIDAASGIVRVAGAIDAETAASHSIIVRATSADGSSSTGGFTVAVRDVNEFNVAAISDVNAGADQVAENATPGTSVGITALAIDADATNNTISYTLDNNAGGRFAINASTGVVTVAGAINRETDASHQIVVRATSADGSGFSASFTIAVLPVNDNAPVITSNGGAPSAAISVSENSTAVTTVTATDADVPPTPLAYSIIGGNDQAFFQIDALTGVLRFTNAPDFETPADADADNTYDVIVQAGDGTLGGSQALAVRVLNLNEAPVNGVPGSQLTAKNTALVFSSAGGNAITVSDVDAGTLTVTLNAGGGTLTLAGTAGLSFSAGSGSDDASMTFNGSIAAINTALNGLRFTPTTAFTGSASLQIVTGDQGASGAGGAQTDTDLVSISVTDASLWLSTRSGTTSSAGSGGLTWNKGQVVNFGNPNLALGSGTSSGTFSAVLSLDSLAADGSVDVNGLHFVSRSVTVGSSNPITLLAGDVLFTVDSDETFGGLAVTKQDIVCFRPSTPGNYASGSFQIVLHNPGGTDNDVRDFALVETAVSVGGTPLQAGDFLLVLSSGGYDRDIQSFRPTTMTNGATTTGGTLNLLINGSSLGIQTGGDQISGLELVQQAASIGGQSLAAGTLLVSLDGDSLAGTNALAVVRGDIFALDVTATGDASSATASMLLRSADVGLTGDAERPDAIALVQRASAAPVVTLGGSALSYTENDAATAVAPTGSVSDADSTQFGGGSLSAYLSNNGTLNDRLAIRNQGNDAGQIGVVGSDVFYAGTLIGSFSGGDDGSTPLVVSLNAGATLAATQALLQNLTYANVSDNPSTLPRTLSVVLADGSGGVSGAATRTINVGAVNDAPVAAAASASGAEDTLLTLTLGANDIDGAVASFTLQTLPANGTLYLDAARTNVAGAGTAISAVANSLTLYFMPNAHWNGSTSFDFVATDDGSPAPAKASTVATASLTVTPVNDAPIASGSASLAATLEGMLTSSGATVASLYGANFSDAADAGNPGQNQFAGVAVRGETVDVAQGRWQYSTDGGLVWAVFGSPSDSTAVSLGLNDRLRFQPVAGYHGTPNVLSVRLLDNSAALTSGATIDVTTSGGASAISAAVVGTSTSITSVNDAPTGADRTVVTAEDVPYVFRAADFGVGDSNDSPANRLLAVRIETLPATGQMTLAGMAVVAGEFVSASDIAAGRLEFTAVAGASSASYASFNFRVQDDGGVLNGGIDLDLFARTMTIDVTAVNDAPVGASKTVTTLEDTPYTFTVADFGFNDPNDVAANNFLAVTIARLPGAGSLTLTGIAVSAGQTVLASDIASNRLRFTPAANANGAGYTSFGFQVQDDGTTANGGVDTDLTPRVMTIDVTAVNDAPMGASKTVTTLEDTPYTFTVADFGFTDPIDASANNFVAVTIATLPGAGSLTLNGIAVSAGQSVTTSDISGGLLRFTPAANANGAGYTSFGFQVQDDGKTANGGVDTDLTPRLMTIDVTAVNDAPVGASKTVTTLEDTPYTFTVADFGFTDPADSPANNLLAVTVATLPDAGSLTLNGIAVTAGQTVLAGNLRGGLLRFAPAADAIGGGYASFTFLVRDDGGTANGGVDADITPRRMTIDVTAVNDAPTPAASIPGPIATQGLPFSFLIPSSAFVDPDVGDRLGYTVSVVSPVAWPAWLVFDAATGSFSGTPGHADVGVIALRVTATDGGGLSASSDFVLTVANVNDAPTVAQPVPDQNTTEGATFSFTVPETIIVDIDAGDALTFGATLTSGDPLPSWLRFDAATRSFVGMPKSGDSGMHVLRLTATDQAGASVATDFVLMVSVAPPASAPLSAPAPAVTVPEPVPAATTDAPEPEPVAPVAAKPAPGPAAVPVPVEAGPLFAPTDDRSEAPAVATARHAGSSDALVAVRPASRSDAVLAAAVVPQFTNLSASSMSQMLSSSDLQRRFEELQRRLDEAAENRRDVIASGVALSGGLSVGYVVWLVRGGVLVSSMLSALPAWQMIDPLPVLAASRGPGRSRAAGDGDPDDTDDPAVERLFDDGGPAGNAPQRAPAAPTAAAAQADPANAAAPAVPAERPARTQESPR